MLQNCGRAVWSRGGKLSESGSSVLFKRFLSSSQLQNDSSSQLYGVRTPKVIELSDYTKEELDNRSKNANLLRLVDAYRQFGIFVADLDPLNMQQKPVLEELDPRRYGIPLNGAKFDITGILHVGEQSGMSLKEAPVEKILDFLKKTYCGKISHEFSHIPNVNERRWFAQTVESLDRTKLRDNEKKRMFELMARSEVFDHFMAKRFTQVKRYGLEGAESLMVAMDTLFKSASKSGVFENVLCMPHRGRLNLLTDLLQYSPVALFHKIKGNSEFPDEFNVSGDVLSHLANSVHLNYGDKEPLHVTMLHNPSHLEAVNPVAMGKARAKQQDLIDSGVEKSIGDRVMCIQLHGDAAFSGQGVVMESLGLSNLPHFTSGGSIHIVVNNQIGYTTLPHHSRSSIYATDVGKMINAPVIHVNGDDPEEVAFATQLAFEYRHAFRKDVIIDLIAYRRWGHNELDEPAFTQPLMYKNIRSRKSVPRLYEEELLKTGLLKSEEEVEKFREEYMATLDKYLEESRNYAPKADYLKGKWAGMTHPTEAISRMDTGVDLEVLKKIGLDSVQLPSGFVAHPRLLKHHIEARTAMMNSGSNIDWATAEALAFGSLMLEGYNVRISGQDVGRGTFSQRHAVMVDQDTESTVIPLNQMTAKQGKLEVANSSLSEFAVMGFEYGMSLESANNLNIWEAQFGDFFNGAQIIIDTYLANGEQKWLRQSGMVLLLPHGFDGAGPEHSSCRIERFLQLSDDRMQINRDPYNINWHVINPTTPAQYFHALRRQMKRPYRKPLVVVAPKTLLKLAAAVSDFDQLVGGNSFEPVLMDQNLYTPDKVEKVVLLSGKLFYDLVKEREARNLTEKIAFIRLEELCPFPADGIERALAVFPNAQKYVWCQEEPRNMGAYSFIAPRLSQLLPEGFSMEYVGRIEAAAPATGISKVHKKENEDIINAALQL